MLARLSSCIAYNQENLREIVPVVEHTREIVIAISDTLSHVKRMVSFNNELMRLRNVQNAGNRRGNYNYRNANTSFHRPVSEDDILRDTEQATLVERLNTIRNVRERLVSSLAILLENREKFTVDNDNCIKCFK